MVCCVLDVRFVVEEAEHPSIAPGDWISMRVSKKVNAVLHALKVTRVVKMLISHGIGEQKSGAAHQVASNGVINSTIFLEEVVKAALRVYGARVIKVHRVPDVAQEELAVSEVR
jgi:hypothetical protein